MLNRGANTILKKKIKSEKIWSKRSREVNEKKVASLQFQKIKKFEILKLQNNSIAFCELNDM